MGSSDDLATSGPPVRVVDPVWSQVCLRFYECPFQMGVKRSTMLLVSQGKIVLIILCPFARVCAATRANTQTDRFLTGTESEVCVWSTTIIQKTLKMDTVMFYAFNCQGLARWACVSAPKPFGLLHPVFPPISVFCLCTLIKTDVLVLANDFRVCIWVLTTPEPWQNEPAKDGPSGHSAHDRPGRYTTCSACAEVRWSQCPVSTPPTPAPRGAPPPPPTSVPRGVSPPFSQVGAKISNVY